MYDIEKLPGVIDIGYTGELDFRKVQIDMTKWMEKMPDGIPSIVHIRPGENTSDAYIAATTFADNILTWTITDGDLGSVEGVGIMQVWLEKEQNDSVVKRGKSTITSTRVNLAVNDPSAEVPAAQAAFMEQMTALKDATVQAALDDAAAVLVQDTQPTEDANKIWMMETPPDSVVVPTYEEHQTKADKVSGAVSGNFAGLDGNGNLVDSGHKHSDYVTDVSGKADKVSDATNGNFAGLDSNGNLTDSGHKHSDYLTSHQDISGKADKASGATSGHFAGLDSNGNLTDSGSKASDFLTAHQDISGKADKVASATNGNFAALDSNGNLTDSGHKHSDYLTQHQDISGKLDKTDFYATEMPMSSGDSTKVSEEIGSLKSAIDGLEETLPTEDTGQELLEYEGYNTGLTDTALAVIGMIFNNLPQDEPAIDIVNSLSLECERLNAIYENWMSERSE